MAVVALGPVARAAAYTDLAESYLKSGKRAEARKQTLAALEVAPSYERAQTLLLQLSEARP
jgi:Tfp pilus assembly protein PilF